MTFARFRGLGKYPSLVIALSKCRIALRPSCGSPRIMSVVIWSGPGALRGWRCLTTPLSSPIVNARSLTDKVKKKCCQRNTVPVPLSPRT